MVNSESVDNVCGKLYDFWQHALDQSFQKIKLGKEQVPSLVTLGMTMSVKN